MSYLQKSKRLIAFVLVIAFLTSQMGNTVSGQTPTIETSDNNLYFWRANLNNYDIIDAQIFPQISFTTNLRNLGSAWVTWNLNTSDGIVGVNAMYIQGERTELRTDNIAYDEITWFAISTTLISVGVSGNTTRLSLFLSNGGSLVRDIQGRTTNHQLFVGQSGYFLQANNTGKGIMEQYRIVDQIRLEVTPTEDNMIAGGINGAVLNTVDNGRIFYQGTGGNISLPFSLSNNLRVGHVQLNPAVFDLTNQRVWLPSTSQFYQFPSSDPITEFSFYGLKSSIIFGNNSLYELNQDTEWEIIGDFENRPFDYSVVDIGLYLGPVIKRGLGLATSGYDLDGDNIPDTMEDYFGSLNTMSDTDGDGISDKDEIINGLDPSTPDSNLDYDNDLINNGNEVMIGLDPLNSDTDYGGAIDGWEVNYNYDPFSPNDDDLDDDNDGITNSQESRWNSNPRSKDTDQDGLPDSWEIEFGIDPTIENANDDPDGDGKTNLEEYQEGTDPLVKNEKPLFEGAYLELSIILSFSFVMATIMWLKYPKVN